MCLFYGLRIHQGTKQSEVPDLVELYSSREGRQQLQLDQFRER